MSVYWCFQLSHVANRLRYLEGMKETETYQDIQRAITAYLRTVTTIRKRQGIPD
jgi:hypothetical protein